MKKLPCCNMTSKTRTIRFFFDQQGTTKTEYCQQGHVADSTGLEKSNFDTGTGSHCARHKRNFGCHFSWDTKQSEYAGIDFSLENAWMKTGDQCTFERQPLIVRYTSWDQLIFLIQFFLSFCNEHVFTCACFWGGFV